MYFYLPLAKFTIFELCAGILLGVQVMDKHLFYLISSGIGCLLQLGRWPARMRGHLYY